MSKKTSQSRLFVYTLVLVQGSVTRIMLHIKHTMSRIVILVPRHYITVLSKLGTTGHIRWYTRMNPERVSISPALKTANVIQN